jgi:hypothetical protein
MISGTLGTVLRKQMISGTLGTDMGMRLVTHRKTQAIWVML